MLISGVHISESVEKNFDVSEERHKNGQSNEKLSYGVRESCLISFIKVKVREYFQSQLVNVLEEGSRVVQRSSSIS